MADQFDYIIVGGGTAGCLLANRLSANPKNRVLLLEAGGKDSYFWIHVPVGYLYTMNNPRTDWMMSLEPEEGLNGRQITYPRGKVIGGCTSINGMIYMRGQAADYDGWRQLGNTGWGWDDVLPYFKKTECHFGGETEMHGGTGEWHVQKQRLNWPILDAFRNAAVEVGIPKTDDFNTGNNEGNGYFEVNQRKGVRWHAGKAFLDPIRSRKNLRVELNATVTGLDFDGKTVIGVRYLQKEHEQIAQAAGEVILSAGAINSPAILERAGIGDPEVLKAAGIGVLHELNGVGANLQDHLQVRAVYRLKNGDTLNQRVNSLLGKARMVLEYLLLRSGPMAMAPSQLGVFTKSDPRLATPDLEFHIQPLSTNQLGDPLHPFPAITVAACALRPESRGTVHITSPDARSHPAIAPNYLSTPGDRQVAARGIQVGRKIMGANAVSAYEPEEMLPGPQYASDEELAKKAGDIATTIFHPVGTAKMGTDAGAVVDPQLRVHGLNKLRVVDASIMPNIVSGNTASPTVMIAEKASDLILDAAA